MDKTTTTHYDFYLPSASEQEGSWQPLATALPLDSGKRLCEQHFLKRCRTLLQRLPPDQQNQVSFRTLEAITLQWKVQASGEQEGNLSAKLPDPLGALANMTYKLKPTV